MRLAIRQEKLPVAPVADTLLVEASGMSIMVSLGRAMDLIEIWQLFYVPNRRQPICTLREGLARVTF